MGLLLKKIGNQPSAIRFYLNPSTGPSLDSDAQAFITAASITDETQQSAINTLVLDMKSANIWTKMKAIYPFVGGTATTHKWNLKDPRDLDAAFRLVFFGGVTHDSNGITGNGINGYADTQFNFQSFAVQNHSLTYYNRLEYIDTNARGMMGIFASGGQRLQLYHTSNTIYFDSGGTGTAGSIGSSGVKGFRGLSRESSASYYGINSDGTYAVTTGAGSSTISTTVQLLTMRGTFLYTNLGMSFAHIGDGLSQAEMTDLRTAVINFQTTLGRNV